MINIPYIECPHCGNTEFIKWGFYNRNIYYIENNFIRFDIIEIQRVKCKKCGHTHALLPSFIIPYKQYLLDVILSCIENNNIIYKYKFSEDTIMNWKKQFIKFLPYLKTMLVLSSLYEIIRTIKNNIFDVYKRFYIVNKTIIMMIKRRILNMAYF